MFTFAPPLRGFLGRSVPPCFTLCMFVRVPIFSVELMCAVCLSILRGAKTGPSRLSCAYCISNSAAGDLQKERSIHACAHAWPRLAACIKYLRLWPNQSTLPHPSVSASHERRRLLLPFACEPRKAKALVEGGGGRGRRRPRNQRALDRSLDGPA